MNHLSLNTIIAEIGNKEDYRNHILFASLQDAKLDGGSVMANIENKRPS